MDRADKQTEVDNLSNDLKGAQIALCADYGGLSVAQMTNLRRELKKVGSSVKVVKNTLARLSLEKVLAAAEKSEREKFSALFDGPSMLVCGREDPVAPAKVIHKFIKDNEKLQVKGAWVDGVFVDAAGVVLLSSMPGKKEMQAKLLSLLCAPATQLVRLLQAPGAQFVRLLEAYRKKLEGGAQQ